MGVLTNCRPRKEVLKGDLDDAIFAADFGDLIDGSAPSVYKDAKTFFQNTHPAKPLCSVARRVFERLAAPKEAGAFVRLSTGFGGGKTHTLMAFWHLANNVADASLGTELVPAASRPKKVTVAAIDAGEAGVPDFSLHGKTIIQSLWGELFYQLGGKDGWTKLGKADHPEASPREKLIETVMPSGPVLIQGPDEQILQRPQGQVSVMNFLKAKGLVYEPGDALDTGRFLKDVLPGTTPIPGDPAVYTAKAIHERFLSAPKLRLVPDPGVVRQTLVKAIATCSTPMPPKRPGGLA